MACTTFSPHAVGNPERSLAISGVPERSTTPRIGSGSATSSGVPGIRRGARRNPHGQVSARRMPHDDNASEIQMMTIGKRAELVDRAAYVEIGARPSAARLVQTSVLDTPRGDAIHLERIGQRADGPDRGELAPTPAVNQHHNRVQSRTARHPKLTVLARVLPVGDAVGRRAVWQRQEVRRRHHAAVGRRASGGRPRARRGSPSARNEEREHGGRNRRFPTFVDPHHSSIPLENGGTAREAARGAALAIVRYRFTERPQCRAPCEKPESMESLPATPRRTPRLPAQWFRM